ncbi:MAG: hypothetical protein AMXMBFR36_15380 [Acidobacteriota bacterium]
MTANHQRASEAVAAFVAAVNRGDLEAALRLYDADAVFVPEPGTVVVGREAIRDALSAMLAARPRIVTSARIVLAGEDLALYHSEWTMEAADPGGETVRETGRSADVLRRDAGGTWRIAIDNPWGTRLL